MTWTPSPAATTLSEIVKAAAGYVLMPTDDEVLDVGAQGVRLAIGRLNTRTWNWSLTPATITFVAGTREYDLDQQFKAPANLSLRNSAGVDIDRISYLPWGMFLKECQWDGTGSPIYYSANNPHSFGTIHLDRTPDAAFVSQHPTGQLWYYRRIQLPVDGGTSLDVPSEVVSYIQEFASGFTADRFAVDKARDAYRRAAEMFNPGPGPAGALVRDDCHGQQADWE